MSIYCQNSPLFLRNGKLLFSLYLRYYTQTFLFATRLIINKINKIQWASAPLFLRNGELLGHSPIRNIYPTVFRVESIRKCSTVKSVLRGHIVDKEKRWPYRAGDLLKEVQFI